MAQNNKDNVTVGKPTPGGAVFYAPAGTALPDGVPTNDPFTDLGEAFTNLGYVSEDGLTKTTTEEGDDLVAWGGDIVAHNQTNFSKTFALNFIEVVNEDVLALLMGKDNVKKREDGVLQVDEVADSLPHFVLVIYTTQGNGDNMRIHRQVVGDAQITDRSGDETYNNSDLVALPATVTAFKFTDTIDSKQKLVRNEWSEPVTAVTDVSSVSITPSTASVAVNATKKLSATVTPSDASDKTVTWKSDKTSVATVSTDGTVTGKAAGTANITATSASNPDKTATCVVTVTAS